MESSIPYCYFKQQEKLFIAEFPDNLLNWMLLPKSHVNLSQCMVINGVVARQPRGNVKVKSHAIMV